MLDILCRNSPHLEGLLKKKLASEEDLKILKWMQQENQEVVEEWLKTVAWMRQVTNQTGFQCDTFTLAVHILDSFIGLMKIHGKYLKCAAASSVYIASKINEEKEQFHSMEDFLTTNRMKFTSSDIVRMERIIVQKLGWELIAKPTGTTFLEIYFNLLCANHFETVFGSDSLAYSIYRSLASQLEHCYCEPNIQQFTGSVKALSLLSCTMEKITSQWFLYIDPLARMSQISIQELLDCRERIKIDIFGHVKPVNPKMQHRRKLARRSSQYSIPRLPRTLLNSIAENPEEYNLQTKYRSGSFSTNGRNASFISDDESCMSDADSENLQDITDLVDDVNRAEELKSAVRFTPSMSTISKFPRPIKTSKPKKSILSKTSTNRHLRGLQSRPRGVLTS